MEANRWIEKAKGYVLGTAKTNTELTVAEVSSLWRVYMHYTMLSCVFRYFEKVEADESDIRPLMSEALGLSEKRSRRAADIMKKESIIVPCGFTEKDVNLNAPRLYTDSFHLYYIRNMSRFSLVMNTLNLSISTRSDMIDFFEECIDTTVSLSRKAVNVMLSRGILPRHPFIHVSDERDIIRQTSFLAGFIGEKRPLLAEEVNHLYLNSLINHIGRVFLAGFAQVAKSKKVRGYMLEGIKIADSVIEDFISILREDGIPAPLPGDAGVADSTEAPFSDKLMMAHVIILNASGIGAYGVSLAASPRNDIVTRYAQMMAKVGMYTQKGVKIMMENGWMEEPPQVFKGNSAGKINRQAVRPPDRHDVHGNVKQKKI
ncbi:MAG: DUF3231 family protein [Desulfotomaculaceae bacterium]|nr:DUF3231 family protein [Desulfotomaculaceae bacterium]